jgi:hypothetical protein
VSVESSVYVDHAASRHARCVCAIRPSRSSIPLPTIMLSILTL